LRTSRLAMVAEAADDERNHSLDLVKAMRRVATSRLFPDSAPRKRSRHAAYIFHELAFPAYDIPRSFLISCCGKYLTGFDAVSRPSHWTLDPPTHYSL